ncbi:transposase [Calidifontibacillus oryziterrae]|uniref:transposase n=1 Tax=Calidifontibacillus oryziterrae TaxID=1191699 RepID=UPI0003100B05|nr:transposase [Calidifontibacillus oryziterrae]
MPRKRRTWYPGAKFHVFSRGNRKQLLFYDRQDFVKYLSLICEAKTNYSFKLQTYCLMSNHVHLQIQTENTNISRIIGYIHSHYARFFNDKYELVGHVFQGRYKAELIQYPDYELEVNRYIHMNPLKANIVNNLNDYPWSSYHAYAGRKLDPLIDGEEIKAMLSYFPSPQISNYEHFLTSDTSPFDVI